MLREVNEWEGLVLGGVYGIKRREFPVRNSDVWCMDQTIKGSPSN